MRILCKTILLNKKCINNLIYNFGYMSITTYNETVTTHKFNPITKHIYYYIRIYKILNKIIFDFSSFFIR